MCVAIHGTIFSAVVGPGDRVFWGGGGGGGDCTRIRYNNTPSSSSVQTNCHMIIRPPGTSAAENLVPLLDCMAHCH